MTSLRSKNTPSGYTGGSGGRLPELGRIYLAKVKDNRDAIRMGRLTVYIPELSPREDADNQWITVNYCSPFGGSTDIKKNTTRNESGETQRSYGFWAVPPDLGNHVLVVFPNSDLSSGFWFGCVFQEQMNHMIPGIAASTNVSNATTSSGLPVEEYNKKSVISNLESPARPVFKPLTDGLQRQGLLGDQNRGLSFSSARRTGDHGTSALDSVREGHRYQPALVYGWSSPRGASIVIDDGYNGEREDEVRTGEMIRIRTRSGVQLLISEAEGYIYAINKNGSGWIEISPSGNIDLYGQTINARAELDINLRAGRNINIEAENNINVKTVTGSYKEDIAINLDQFIGGEKRSTVSASRNEKIGGSAISESSGRMHLKTGSAMVQQSESDFSLRSSGYLKTTASQIHLNSDSVPADNADTAMTARKPTTNKKDDIKSSGNSQYEMFSRNTIVSRMPTHEPYPDHETISGTFNGSVVEAEENRMLNGRYSLLQSKPVDFVGKPLNRSRTGVYKGTGFKNDEPQYEYAGTETENGLDETLQNTSTLRISDNGLDFIGRWEGFEPYVYEDVAGLETIGYGHLLTAQEKQSGSVNIDGVSYPLSSGLDRDQARALLRQDAANAERAVQQRVKVELTQSQFDSLASFVFNVGSSAFSNSTLLKRLNSGDYSAVPGELMRWNKARVDGELVEVNGLTRRRESEASIFTSVV